MDSTRWRDIERICEAALAAEPDRRVAVLDDLCKDDTDLRRDVEALLAQTARTNGFLEAPVLEDAAGMIAGRGGGGAADPSAAAGNFEDVLLPEGTRLGPYELVAPLGAGGMGTVYEARDTRLERTVAIKVLPPGFATDPDPSTGSGSPRAGSRDDRRGRFQREAKTIAGLNHPHICTLHDTGEAVVSGSGTPDPGSRVPDPVSVSYLVMEHLTGETLAARLERGPLPVPLACELGAQIADALAAAHRHGVIHRDLKPANIMLTPGEPGSNGVPRVKLLDFGLAKLTGHGEQPIVSRDGAHVTETDSLTARGTILGTLPYMAPEQLEGRPADARTDLWALGCILYEMLTGARAFVGDTAVTLMGHILTSEPSPLREAHPTVPPALDRLVRKCLAKQPDDRWDSAHDVADELRWVRDASVVPSVMPASGGGRSSRALTHASVALVLVVTAATATWMLTRPAPTPPEVRHVFIDTTPADGLRGPSIAERTMAFNRPGLTAIALSPDGTTLVFSGIQGERQQLYKRRLEDAAAVPMDGTEGAEGPVFSPDGRWVAYSARNALWKVRMDGGVPVRLGTAEGNGASSWSRTNEIASDILGIATTPGSGGDSIVRLPDTAGSDESYGRPHFLPDGNALLFTVYRRVGLDGRTDLLSLTSGARLSLLDHALDARYVPTGHLVYAHMGRLWAVPFDLDRNAVAGEPGVVLADVMQAVNCGCVADTGAAQISFSDTGTLAYVTGGVVPDVQSELVWVDRAGTVTEVLPLPAGPYSVPRISPDGRRILYARSGTIPSLWYYDVDDGIPTLIPTPGRVPRFPHWFPDGQRVLYTDVTNDPRLFTVPVHGDARPAPLPGTVKGEATGSWMPDGTLVYTMVRAPTGAIWKLQWDGQVPVRSLLVDAPTPLEGYSPAYWWATWPAVSPDGQLLAYVSNETGRHEVYVGSLRHLEAKRRISPQSGRAPVWRRDGRELFYLSEGPLPRKMMAIGVPLEPGSAWGQPRVLFDVPGELYTGTNNVAAYDVSPDGQRFLFVRRPPTATPPPPSRINIVFNWFEELKAKIPRTGNR